MLTVPWKDGSQHTLETLGATGAVVSDSFAKKHDLTVGSPLQVLTPYDKTIDLRVNGIFKVPKGGSPFGSVTTSAATFDANFPNPQNVFTLINIRGGVTPANTALLDSTLQNFPDAKIQTEKQFEHAQEQGINILLNLLFVLLGLSIVISIFGIVNTLVLTVFERTRELGMLRAVGMTQVQVRRMIRHESVVTSLIGAALGIADRDRTRCADRSDDRVLRLLAAGGSARRLRDRRGDRRDPRGDLPGAAGLAAERPAGAPVRVTREELLAL